MAHFLSQKDFNAFLDALSRDYAVYVPVKKGEQRFYAPYSVDIKDIVVGEVRPFEPLKAFLAGRGK